jgi:hypothetical protein
MQHSKPKEDRRIQRSTRRSLDGLVVNIELTLVSIIQGVALSVLAESAHTQIGELRFEQWPYIASGLLIILLFWSRSITHTLTLIRWPLEFRHNFLYIACTFVEAIVFNDLADPFRWFMLNGAFAIVIWLLFIADLRLIRQRRAEAVGSAENQLYDLVMRDQKMNIRWLVPGLAIYNFVAAGCIYFWPEPMLRGGLHDVFAVAQTITLIGYLIYVVRFFRLVAPGILEANQEESAV